MDSSPAAGSNRLYDGIVQTVIQRFPISPVQVIGPVHIRDNSLLFHARVEHHPPLEMAVKCCLLPYTNTPDQTAAAEQYASLQRVSRALRGRSAYRVPIPLFIHQPLATFGMTWTNGVALTQKLHSPGLLSSGSRWFDAAGAWLGAFHTAGPVRNGCFDSLQKLDVVGDFLENPLPEECFIRASRFLEQTGADLGTRSVPVSWVHGDFKTDNILFEGEDVIGIDISLRHENAVEYDIAQFLNHFELLCLAPHHIHLRCLQSHLTKAFLRGYRHTGLDISEDCLVWVRFYLLLSLWRTTMLTRRRGLSTWLLNRMFAELARRILIEAGAV